MRQIARRIARDAAALCAVVLAAAAGVGGELPPRFTETIEGSKEKAPGQKASFTMVLLPAGTFRMGSPETEAGRAKDEGPPHEVTLRSFYLCTTEVTQHLFTIYYDEQHKPTRDDHDRTFHDVAQPLDVKETDNFALARLYGVDAITRPSPVFGDRTMNWGVGPQPAIAVTWLNAVNFCRWLSKKTGKPYRLPTEAEWEYACRAGSTTVYCFGDDPAQIGEYAWFEDNSDEHPHPVGEKKPNAWGLYDMYGNVREWCHDFYDPEAYARDAQLKPCANPLGPKLPVGGQTRELHLRFHVARGGFWGSPADEVRSAARGHEEPRWRFKEPQYPKSRWWLPEQGHIGFRVACDADGGK